MIHSLRRRRPGTPWFAALLAGGGLLALAPEPAPGQAETRVTVDPGGERISISSSGATRAELLELLRTRYHIEIRPYLQPDERVSIRVENVPIDSAIAVIMPRGSRYAIRLGERDVTHPASSNAEKRGPKARRPAGLGPKAESRLRRPIGPRFKPDPERVVGQTAPTGRKLKPVADADRIVPPGLGPKVPRTPAGRPDSTLRITFTIRAPDSVRVTGAQLIDGATPQSAIVRGPFVFVVRGSAGAVLYYGTLVDPLEEHSYEDTAVARHGVAPAREGTFGISLPAASVQRLAGARLDFYDASAASLPATLTRDALERILARSKPAGRVDGRAVIAAFRKETRP
jgi:hypothetical protein